MRRIRSGCCARAASGQPGGGANNLHEITPSHCRPRSRTTLFGIQLPSSKQKIASSETGSMPNVRCRNPERRMSHMGHQRRGSDVGVTSAFHPLATGQQTSRQVACGPEAVMLLPDWWPIIKAAGIKGE